jgi:hypothetical protein
MSSNHVGKPRYAVDIGCPRDSNLREAPSVRMKEEPYGRPLYERLKIAETYLRFVLKPITGRPEKIAIFPVRVTAMGSDLWVSDWLCTFEPHTGSVIRSM